jgi:hypothetical protein
MFGAAGAATGEAILSLIVLFVAGLVVPALSDPNQAIREAAQPV